MHRRWKIASSATGEVQTACQQARPTKAIVFGDMNNSGNRVTKLKAEKLDYSLLVAKRGAEVIELGGIFAGQDELLRVETVLEGVLRRTELSDGAFGSGTVLGVGAIYFRAASFYGLGGLGSGLIGRHVYGKPARKIAGAPGGSERGTEEMRRKFFDPLSKVFLWKRSSTCKARGK